MFITRTRGLNRGPDKRAGVSASRHSAAEFRTLIGQKVIRFLEQQLSLTVALVSVNTSILTRYGFYSNSPFTGARRITNVLKTCTSLTR